MTLAGERRIRVALTFDAEHPDRSMCPPGNAERILDTLREAGARATFFVQGRWAMAHPEAAARVGAEGHVVGNHSHYHTPMPLLTDKGIRADIRLAGAAIRRATGMDPRPWFRCPFNAGDDDPRVLSALADLGYRNVSHHVALEDWEPLRNTAGLVEDALQRVLSRGDGTVILLHTWPAVTSEALPVLLERLDSAGARFVGVNELEKSPESTIKNASDL